jgi:hypothetical protein
MAVVNKEATMKRQKTNVAPLPPQSPSTIAESSNKKGKSATVRQATSRPIASLRVRVGLGIAAVLLILLAGVILVNLKAIDTYNQATTSLNANIEYAKKPDADQQQLKARLDQTKAQFEQAKRLSILLPSDTKKTINFNQRISQKLTTNVERKLAKVQADAKNPKGQNTDTGSQSPPAGQNGETGLTEEQRKQVEDVLKANTNNGGVADGKKSQPNDGKDAGVKPW